MKGYKEFKNSEEMWKFINKTERIDPYRKNSNMVIMDQMLMDYLKMKFGKNGEPQYYKKINKEDFEKILDVARRLNMMDVQSEQKHKKLVKV